jgi:hypothetical protein
LGVSNKKHTFVHNKSDFKLKTLKMGTLRFKAIEKAISRQPVEVKFPSVKTSEYFAINVFNKKRMQEYLSQEAFNSVMEAIEKAQKLTARFPTRFHRNESLGARQGESPIIRTGSIL